MPEGGVQYVIPDTDKYPSTIVITMIAKKIRILVPTEVAIKILEVNFSFFSNNYEIIFKLFQYLFFNLTPPLLNPNV